MAAQRDAGLMARGTAGTGNDNVTGGLPENPPVIDAPITLAEVGIDKNLADRARKYAAIPDEEFNATINDWRDRVEQESERVTVNLLAAGEKHVRGTLGAGLRFHTTDRELIVEMAIGEGLYISRDDVPIVNLSLRGTHDAILQTYRCVADLRDSPGFDPFAE